MGVIPFPFSPMSRSRFLRTCAAAAIGCASLASAALAQSPFARTPFTDVPKTHANYQAIETLRTQNVLRGYTDGTFRPESRISRAEFVRLIVNPFFVSTERLTDCLREEVDARSQTVFFKDVRRDDWFAKEVCLAKVTELIDGYDDGLFRPTRSITAAEAAKIVSNALVLGVSEEPDGQWYAPYLKKLAEEKALPTTIRSVNQAITRGEMAEILWRLRTNKTALPSRSYESLSKR